MLVGDPNNRDAKKVPSGNCYRCEANMQQSPFGGAPCTGSDTKNFPKSTCGGGWRVTVTFPSCWDGKNLDSPDHRSHVAYPASGTFESGVRGTFSFTPKLLGRWPGTRGGRKSRRRWW